MKYHLISLGCSKNLVDSEVFSNILKRHNLTNTLDINEANYIIINTCGFIQAAKEEAIAEMLEAVEISKTSKAKIVVTGCLIKRYKKKLEKDIPEITHYIDLKDFEGFSQIFSKTTNIITPNFFERDYLTLPHFGYLRISDGCENFCSYCAIPLIRGKMQSVPVEILVKEANRMADKGVIELIITAQDTSNYGADIYGKPMLNELLIELNKIKKLRWIRLLYLHPAHLTSSNIYQISKLDKILPYFDLPIQHISDGILSAMNRKSNAESIKKIIALIRKTFPLSVLRTTLIVGFPAETEADFEMLKEFVIETKFEHLGVFSYSKEEDTAAFELSKEVDFELSEKRKNEILSIQEGISKEILEKYIGAELEVIVDKISDEEGVLFEGRAFFDSPEVDGVIYIIEGNCKIGEIVKVEIIDSAEFELWGIMIVD